MLLILIMVLSGCGAQSYSDETVLADPPPTPPPPVQAPAVLQTPHRDDIPLTVELTIHDRSPKIIMVHQDGRVTLTEQDSIEEINASSEDLALVHQAVEEQRFFDLENDYPGSRCCDAIAHTITVTTSLRAHSVYCYNECPAAFEQLIQDILMVWPSDIEYKGLASFSSYVSYVTTTAATSVREGLAGAWRPAV